MYYSLPHHPTNWQNSHSLLAYILSHSLILWPSFFILLPSPCVCGAFVFVHKNSWTWIFSHLFKCTHAAAKKVVDVHSETNVQCGERECIICGRVASVYMYGVCVCRAVDGCMIDASSTTAAVPLFCCATVDDANAAQNMYRIFWQHTQMQRHLTHSLKLKLN